MVRESAIKAVTKGFTHVQRFESIRAAVDALQYPDLNVRCVPLEQAMRRMKTAPLDCDPRHCRGMAWHAAIREDADQERKCCILLSMLKFVSANRPNQELDDHRIA